MLKTYNLKKQEKMIQQYHRLVWQQDKLNIAEVNSYF